MIQGKLVFRYLILDDLKKEETSITHESVIRVLPGEKQLDNVTQLFSVGTRIEYHPVGAGHTDEKTHPVGAGHTDETKTSTGIYF